MSSFLKVGTSLFNTISQTLQDTFDDEEIETFNEIPEFYLSSSSSNFSSISSSSSSSSSSNQRGILIFYLLDQIIYFNYLKNSLLISYNNKFYNFISTNFFLIKRLSIYSLQLEYTTRGGGGGGVGGRRGVKGTISNITTTNQSRSIQPIILMFKNEPDLNLFLKYLLYINHYWEVIQSSYQELLRDSYNNNQNILTKESLFHGYQLYNIQITNKQIDEIIKLSSSSSPSSSSSSTTSTLTSNQFDFISFFDLLLDIPVFNTYDCLIGLLSRIGQHDLIFTPLQESLLLGEVRVKNIHHIRWTICNNDIDINNLTFDRTSWYGSLIFTNYRLILYCEQKKASAYSKDPLPSFFNTITIPLNSILKVQLSKEPASLSHFIRLHIVTKDFKLIRIHFISPTRDFTYNHATVFTRQLLNGIFVTSPQRIFCFHYAQKFKTDGWKFSNISYDYTRLNIFTDPEWTILNNSRGELVPSYPSFLAVPSKVPYEDIQACISFRCLGRLPVLTYRHSHTQCSLVRSAQPLISQSQLYGQSDILLLDAYRTSGILNQLRYVTTIINIFSFSLLTFFFCL